jgi:hypothetical protein
MSEIEKAISIVDDLETRKAQHIADGQKLEAERATIALDAFTGNDKARKRLDFINASINTRTSELAAIEAAIAKAHQRVEGLRQEQAAAADRQRAKQAQVIAEKIGARLKRAHAALNNGFEEIAAAEQELSELHKHGVQHPGHAAFRVNCVLSLKTLLRKLPTVWRRDFADRVELGHSERLTLITFWSAVQTSIDRQLAVRLGNEAKAKEPAA